MNKRFSLNLIKATLVLFIWLFFVPTNLYAVPAYDGFIELQQPSKFTFKARLYGDEWYNWVETNDGYGIYQNMTTGNWEYYLPSAGEGFKGGVVSSPDGSTTVVGDADPIVLGIPKGLRPPRTTISLRESVIDDSPTISAPVSGAKYVLFIGVDYVDQPATYTESQFSSLLLGSSASINDYFSNVSYSELTVVSPTESHGSTNNGFIGWLRLSGNHPNTGANPNSTNQQIAKDAIEAADPFIDYSAYDSDGDGVVEPNELSIVVIVAGYERSYSADSPAVWGHRWSMWAVGYPSVDGKTIRDYAQFGESHGTHMATIGIMAHELGHLLLSLPDLYDTNNSNGSSEGIGGFGLMGAGSWAAATGTYAGSSPTHLSAWSKEYIAWGIVTTISATQSVTLPKSEGNSS